MAVSAKDPVFTTKGWIAYGIMCVVYATILFSMDPEWVAWAGPLVFGGSLVAQDPPPASAHLTSTPDTLLAASLFGFAGFCALELLRVIRSKPDSHLLTWLRDRFEEGTMAKVWSHLKSEAGLTQGR